VLFAHFRSPGSIRRRFAISGMFKNRIESQTRIREYFYVGTAVVDEFARIICDANEPRVPKYGWRPISDLVIELSPDREHEIGLLHYAAAHRSDDARMIVSYKTTALLGVG
jgi:hypothetical protein